MDFIFDLIAYLDTMPAWLVYGSAAAVVACAIFFYLLDCRTGSGQ